MRVAIIEDEHQLADTLTQGFASESHDAEVFPDAKSARALETTGNRYDLILLDLMLPDGDGKDVCRQLREAGVRTPILVLTARDSIEDRIDLLDRGADDFLGKPFSFDELLARSRALARRSTVALDDEVVLGELCVNVGAHTVMRGTDLIPLTAREFELLLYLMRNRDHIVDRAELLSKVWKQNDLALTNVVDVHIRNVRKKIDDDYDTKYIQTVHGVGYTIVG